MDDGLLVHQTGLEAARAVGQCEAALRSRRWRDKGFVSGIRKWHANFGMLSLECSMGRGSS